MGQGRIGSLLLVCLVVFTGALHAEPAKTITIKVFDGKTGHPIMPTGFEIRVDHLKAIHIDWVRQNDDGTAELTLPDDVHEISVHLAYDHSMEIYVNCDEQKSVFGDIWYLVPQIVSEGMVAGNGCGKTRVNEKYKTTALPGELILFVRERNWRERARDE